MKDFDFNIVKKINNDSNSLLTSENMFLSEIEEILKEIFDPHRNDIIINPENKIVIIKNAFKINKITSIEKLRNSNFCFLEKWTLDLRNNNFIILDIDLDVNNLNNPFNFLSLFGNIKTEIDDINILFSYHNHALTKFISKLKKFSIAIESLFSLKKENKNQKLIIKGDNIKILVPFNSSIQNIQNINPIEIKTNNLVISVNYGLSFLKLKTLIRMILKQLRFFGYSIEIKAPYLKYLSAGRGLEDYRGLDYKKIINHFLEEIREIDSRINLKI